MTLIRVGIAKSLSLGLAGPTSFRPSAFKKEGFQPHFTPHHQEMIFDRELPLDLWVCEIVKHLDSPKDYLKFRATCKSWNLNLPKIPNHMKIPVPRLILPFDYETHGIQEAKHDFFHSSFPIDMPDTLFRGSGFGWLISIGLDGVIRMLNPCNKAQFDLPPMSTTPNVLAYNPDALDEEYTIKRIHRRDRDSTNDDICIANKYYIQEENIKKIIISSHPPDHKNKQQNDDFMAIAIYSEQDQLAFCKLGDNKWREFSIPTKIGVTGGLQDAIFHQGKIYGVDCDARLYEFDVKTSTGSVTDVPPPKDDPYIRCVDSNTKFLVCSIEGDLLMAVRYWTYTKRSDADADADADDDDFYKTSKFNIYKLNKKRKKWRRIYSLGDSVLVVGLNTSICMLPFTNGNGKWVRNCIYFCDNNYTYQHSEIVGGHDVGVFNLEDETIEELFPNAEFIFPPPVWLS
ncbi:hypothetical protein RIF29_36663 [Crotalaria pallida]|uniref:KIB1-4 beta-propeller domain-containing protein n=1 Tax=Crotalaria pallida TaxID=3830 RepID=A0AAN9EDU4_CROPI